MDAGGAAEGHYLGPREIRWVLLATILASGMAFLIGAAVSIALPTIQTSLEASISDLQWIMNAYVLTLAVFILIGGSLGDRYGRKRVFSIGIVVFTLGSLFSGLSHTIEWLIAFQAVMGLGAALMVPGSLAIINSCIPEYRRGKAIGQWAGFSGGIGTLGPFLGGWLVQTFNWQSIFFLTLPFGVIALLTAIRFVPETRNPDASGIDWNGALLISIGLFGISYGLIRGPLDGWNAQSVVAGLGIGAASIPLFLLTEGRAKEPLVPFKIFRKPVVAGANLMTFSLYFALNGVIFFLVLNLQQFQGYSPIQAGLGLLPPFLLITFFSGPAGSLADRIGPRRQMIMGPLIVAAGMALFIPPGIGTDYFRDYMPGLLLFGAGMALVIAPLTKSALAVDNRYSGVASGVNNSIARVAALMAIAALGAVVVSLFSVQLQGHLNASDLTAGEQKQIIDQADRLGGIEIPLSFAKPDRLWARGAIGGSFLTGFRWAMAIGSILALLSSVIAFYTIPPGRHFREKLI